MSTRVAGAGAVLACLLVAATGQAAPRLATGTYVGDGTVGRSITQVGFSPQVLIVRGELFEFPIIATATMPAGTAKLLAGSGGQISGYLQSLDADGFTITADVRVNQAGVTYHWVAFAPAPGEMKVSSYVGNNTDNRSISGVGFAPELLFVFNEGNSNPVLRGSGMTGDLTYEFTANAGIPNAIQALEADGFQVGTDSSVNKQNTYNYVAWRTVPGGAQVGSYVGDGVGGRVIDCGWAPEWVFVKGNAGAYAVFKPITTGAATDQTFPATTALAFSGGITSLTSTGFTLGTHASVNALGASYVWMAFGSVPVGPSDAGVVEPPDAGSPDIGSPDVGQPDIGSPDAGSPDIGEPDVATPDAGTPDIGPADVGWPDAGAADAGEPADAAALLEDAAQSLADASERLDAAQLSEDAAVAADSGADLADGGAAARSDGAWWPLGFEVGCACSHGSPSTALLLSLVAFCAMRRRRS